MIFSKFYIVFLPETFGEVVGTSFRCMGCFIRRFYNTASTFRDTFRCRVGGRDWTLYFRRHGARVWVSPRLGRITT